MAIFKKKFQRNIEDFVCEQCDVEVKGNGYTNHCHNCLWSKHVDVNPGDRSEVCQGMMKPVSFFNERKPALLHECQVCGKEKRNKVAEDDKVSVMFPFR